MVAILAYGSIIPYPGNAIRSRTVKSLAVTTPFAVEYVRISRNRKGAPTLAPHNQGLPVKAQLLLLQEDISLAEAQDLLWRRETYSTERRHYRASDSPNAVVVKDWAGFEGIEHVVYTDFNPEGKLADPDPGFLAQSAVNSVAEAEAGRDGISYLMQMQELGIQTALTSQYAEAILKLTDTPTLQAALKKCLRQRRRTGNS